MLRFYGLRILKDYLGHIILIGLPVALITLMVMINAEADAAPNTAEAARYIGIVYIIMFQGFGAAYTFEGLEHDFFKSFKDRLKASPVNPMRFVFANIGFGVLISFLQSLVLLVYVVVVFGSRIPNLPLVLMVLFLGVVFAQLLAALCIFLLKKGSKAQAAITLYIIGGMVLAGFFFPLPANDLTAWLSNYSTPLAWTHHAVYGLIEGVYHEALLGTGLLVVATLLVGAVVYQLSKRVVT
ncbi:MAG: ABC transporter permease [Acholeplasmatales bacterium]|nr:MAG: ABC transporter permease [Acholeplasmatales bacterium]